MQMLYDSDRYVVVHLLANMDANLITPTEPRHAFEIVDKMFDVEVVLVDDWAAKFQLVINSWQLNTPTQAEVESVLDSYCALAQLPMVVH